MTDLSATRLVAETSTDDDGRFSFTVALDSTATFRIRASLSGFALAERTITIGAEQIINLASPLVLSPVGSGGSGDNGEPAPPRDPRSITLSDRTNQEIGVSGSGSVETTTLTFVVLDGRGDPLDEANSVIVRFSLLNQPGQPGAPGAEFIYPIEAASDENGEARVTLTSGTTAGPVQVRAEVDGPDGLITSTPVVIVIHGGLPDQQYFTVAPARLNFHGRVAYGIENLIRVIVGDMYGNPVQSNTEVYFTTSHGVIGGGAATDGMGRASSTLQAADPLPNDSGLATITARTAGLNGATVTKSTEVLFSGPTRIELELLGGDLEGFGEEYLYRVTDDLGNPIVEGSSVTVTVEGNQIRTLGDMNVTIPDSRTPGENITEFTFLVRKATSDADAPSIDNIRIQVTSPNGNRTYLFVLSPAKPVGVLTPAEILVH